jgi:hypothetical protein
LAFELLGRFEVSEREVMDAPARPGTEARLGEIGEWVAKTCRLHGAPPELAHEVAAMFVAGLRREWGKRAT